MGGKPLADADVMFTNETFVGVAKTDAEGRYRLVQGALPGSNRVSVSRYEGGQGPAPASPQPAGDGMDAGQQAAADMGWGAQKNKTAGPKQLVPADYSNSLTTSALATGRYSEENPRVLRFPSSDFLRSPPVRVRFPGPLSTAGCLLGVCATAPLAAHEGHGVPGVQHGALHYIVNPSHSVPTIVMALVAFGLAWTLFRKLTHPAKQQVAQIPARKP